MMKKIILMVLVLALAVPVFAGELKIEPDQKYLLLATNRLKTMQKELDQATEHGFRIIAGTAVGEEAEIVVLLERLENFTQPYKYEVLATTRTGTMQHELNVAGANGFRLLPLTMGTKDNILTREIVLIMENDPSSNKTYDYQLLATTLTSTMQKEILLRRRLFLPGFLGEKSAQPST